MKVQISHFTSKNIPINKHTSAYRPVDDLLKANEFDEIQLISRDGKLNDLLEKIQSFDQQILDLYLDEQIEKGYEDEILAIDKYSSEVRVAKVKIDRAFRKHEKVNEPQRPPSEYSTAASEQRQKRIFKLPKIELLKFSGKLIDWLSWWSQFEKIHTDDELHTTDKFEYLRQAMETKTRAKEIVDGYPATGENYPNVIRALQERFGRKKLLIQVYVRELFQMGLKNLNKEVEITTTFDKLVSHVRALESLSETIEQAALLDYLFQFLQQEVEREEQRQLIKGSFSESSNHSNKRKEIKKDKNSPTAACLFNGQTKSISCVFCDKPHESKDCAITEFWTMDELRKKIQEKKVCFICLEQNHTAKTCKSFVKCHVCSKKHFTVMCPEIKEKKINKNSDSSAGTNFHCSQDVLLKTSMVYVMVNSKKILARILFDDGSQRSYATSSLMKAVSSIPFKQEYMRNILFDGTRTECQKFNNHKVCIQSLNGTEKMSVILRERSVLGGRVSRIPKGFWLDEFKNKGIKFKDIAVGKETLADIDIVIGSDYWGTIMKGPKESLPCGLSAFETIWGWTLCGVIPQYNQANNIISMFRAEEEVNKLWSLDVIGIKDPIEKLTQIQEEMVVMKMFRENLKRNAEGRYKVMLPWVDEIPKIPNNKKVATSRLMAVTKKLNINNQFKTYDDIIKSWYDEGFIEKVEVGNENGHCLPHHPVFKDSITTPVRPVFDASCKMNINLSLNDCLYKGPNFIESLPTKLIRFRMKWAGVLSDIRKAFQMIEVDEQDREHLQFLWWEDATQTKLTVWRHCRVVFGLKCSPFLLAAVVEELLSAVKGPKKEIADELKKALHIDNCVTSLDSMEEYEQFKETATEIFANGKFELRQWECASPGDHEEIVGPMETKVLGMIWEKGTDTMRIQTPSLNKNDKLTKRNIASALQKFFEPLGIITAALISPKMMLQQAWKKKIYFILY